jgi:hypothetical protein
LPPPPCWPGWPAAIDEDYANADRKNLTLSLNGEPLLRNVDFSVAPGEC